MLVMRVCMESWLPSPVLLKVHGACGKHCKAHQLKDNPHSILIHSPKLS